MVAILYTSAKSIWRVFKLRPERGSATRSNAASHEIHEFHTNLLLARVSSVTSTLKIGF
jgi:hypothetical protein